MQINNISNLNFGKLRLDKEAKDSFAVDAVSDLKNVKNLGDFYKKMQFAENANIDFFINGNGSHEFRAVAIDQNTGEYYGRKVNTSVHHAINDIIDVVLKSFDKQI